MRREWLRPYRKSKDSLKEAPIAGKDLLVPYMDSS